MSDKLIKQEDMFAILRKWLIKNAEENPLQRTNLDKMCGELAKIPTVEQTSITKTIKFKVIDNNTGKEADVERIALKEEWAKSLIYCDMEGFAITEEGDLILLDECGHYEFCDTARFKVVFEGDDE